MRIVGGRWRGRKLASGAGHFRPTAERIRETLFDILAHNQAYAGAVGPAPAGMVVLEAFAGSGAFGLEALSRGARAVIFLEKDVKAAAILAANVASLGAAADTEILRRDALNLGRAPALKADLVFLDPPYGSGLGARALSGLADKGWLNADALIIAEMAAKEDESPPPGFTLLDARRYGDTKIAFWREASQSSFAPE